LFLFYGVVPAAYNPDSVDVPAMEEMEGLRQVRGSVDVPQAFG
jgi:hypothetical protein